MRLTLLEPCALKIEDGGYRFSRVPLAEADGIQFLCPKCFETNAGPVGTHVVICWKPHVPQTVYPVPGRWTIEGTGFGDLTLGGQPNRSVQLTSGCLAHFTVTNGDVAFA